MFCRKCGKEVDNSQSLCPYCGAEIVGSTGVNFKFNNRDKDMVPENTGYNNNNASNNVFNIPAQNAGTYPMKWYKFLIYFFLFLTAVLNAVTGIGNFFGGFAALQYVGWGLLDSVLGIAQIALAVYAILVRNKLAGYKHDAPNFLYNMYIFSCALTVGYNILLGLFTGFAYFDFGVVAGNVIASVVMVILNKQYFEKRRSLFVNM